MTASDHADAPGPATIAGLALVAAVALFNALGASLFYETPGARGLVRRHIGLDDPLLAMHVFAVDLAAGIVMLLGIVCIVRRFDHRDARQYVWGLGAAALASTVRFAVVYAQATHYSFRLDAIFPEGYFDFLNTPEAQDVLYSTSNRLTALWGYWLHAFGVAAILGCAFLYLRAEARAAEELMQARLDAERMQRETTAARLQMLEAQIEPYFLFNTLANVKRLYQTEPGSGDRMLANLMRYLEEALPHMRGAQPTLGHELALTEAYLAVQQIRMGARLTYTVDVPGPLLDAPAPAMVILTLAENAIKHGLNPLAEGGSLRIAAFARGDRLHLEVADDGRGFTASSGSGTGLANLRARLLLTFGARASLQLAHNAPRGVVAIVEWPGDGRHSASPRGRAAQSAIAETV